MHSCMLPIFVLLQSAIIKTSTALQIPPPIQTESFEQGVLQVDHTAQIPNSVRVSIHQETCPNVNEGICPSYSHCCTSGESCCPHGCCPNAFAKCSRDKALCINDANLTRCTDAKTNEVFAGTPCSYGGCCGRDQQFPYCSLARSLSCVDADGYYPCRINNKAMPGVACGASTCCPNPMRCCGTRCCNQGGVGGPVPIETVAFDIVPATQPKAPTMAPGVSPSVEPQVSVPVSPYATARPSFVQIETGMPLESTMSVVGPQATELASVSASPSLAPSTTSGLTEAPLPSASPSSVQHQMSGMYNQTVGQQSRSKRSCFPGSAVVEIFRVGTRPMSNVHIGNFVRSGPTSHSKVFLWTHDQHSGMHQFVKLTTETGESLTATAGHYVYICMEPGPTGTSAMKTLIAVGDIRPGSDSLCAVRRSRLLPLPVVKTELVWQSGLFNPQTMQGDIVVDGFLSSCYTEALRSEIAHGMLAPFRAVERLSCQLTQKVLAKVR